MTLASDFEVEHYLDHQAEIFLARFDPLTYIYLSRTMDYFEPFAEPIAARRPPRPARLLRQRLALRQRALPPHRRRAARARADARHVEIASPWGHDSFLMDIPAYHAAVAGLLSG